jgi:hypothetical protein
VCFIRTAKYVTMKDLEIMRGGEIAIHLTGPGALRSKKVHLQHYMGVRHWD